MHRSYKINIDKRYRVAPLANCDFVIFSYYLKFNYKYFQSNHPASDYSAIKLIFDVRKDSFYIYQPERIPTFIKNKEPNNFISNDRLQDIIQKHQFKNATSGEEELAPITNIRYSSKTNSFVFEILNFLKIKHDGRITKLGIIVVDAYTGEILEIFTTHKQNLEGCVNNNMRYD